MYLTLKGKDANLTLQHALPVVSSNVAGQFENLVQVAQALQNNFAILGGIYAAPGTPIGDADPLLFLYIITKMLAQLRSKKAHQGTYLHRECGSSDQSMPLQSRQILSRPGERTSTFS